MKFLKSALDSSLRGTHSLGNNNEEGFLEIGKYYLKLCEENMLLLHDALYAPGARRSLLSFASKISLLFHFSSIIYNDNLFCHATLKGVFDGLVK